MTPPLGVRYRLARQTVKFCGARGLRAWWFILREVVR